MADFAGHQKPKRNLEKLGWRSELREKWDVQKSKLKEKLTKKQGF